MAKLTRLTREEIIKVAEKMLNEPPRYTIGQIAKVLGFSRQRLYQIGIKRNTKKVAALKIENDISNQPPNPNPSQTPLEIRT